jgi:hypothetical protein
MVIIMVVQTGGRPKASKVLVKDRMRKSRQKKRESLGKQI